MRVLKINHHRNMKIETGDIIKSVITDLSDVGLEVSHNGYRGTVRIIDIEWNLYGCVKRMHQSYQKGDKIDVLVTAAVDDTFLASIKDLSPEDNPWYRPEIYEKGNIFDGEIIQETDFGYFIKLSSDAEALLLKENSGKHKTGKSIRVKIDHSDPSKEKIIVSEIN